MGVHTPHVCVRARVRACAIGRPRIRADTCERVPAGVDREWLGAQAFQSASAFNANIGAWNTAAVTTLSGVCAAFGPGGAPPRAAACWDTATRRNAGMYEQTHIFIHAYILDMFMYMYI